MSEAADIRDGGGGTVPWREIAAGHEAGHAVVAWHYGARIDLVTVVPYVPAAGGMRPAASSWYRSKLEPPITRPRMSFSC